jgi:hypothetical protein
MSSELAPGIDVFHSGLSTISTCGSMSYTVTARCVRSQDVVYLSHSRFGCARRHTGRGVLGMNLVACDAPGGVLDEAPHTALRQDTSTEKWQGFWADDDRYYARCTTVDGVASWYRLDDGVDAGVQMQSPLLSIPVPRLGIGRRAVVFRVGQGCIVGCRRALKRPAARAATVASRARSSDFSA